MTFFEVDYEIKNEIPSLKEAVRRVARRYGMTGSTDANELCDLCSAYSFEEKQA